MIATRKKGSLHFDDRVSRNWDATGPSTILQLAAGVLFIAKVSMQMEQN